MAKTVDRQIVNGETYLIKDTGAREAVAAEALAREAAVEAEALARETLSEEVTDFKNELSGYHQLSNLIDNTSFDRKTYYSSKFLDKATGDGASTYDPADIQGGATYTISGTVWKAFTWLHKSEWEKFTDVISSQTANQDGSVTFTVPDGYDQIAITVMTEQNTAMLVEGSYFPKEFITDDEKRVKIDGLVIQTDDNINHFYVNKSYTSADSGFGEYKFNSIIDAVNAISNPSEKNKYEIIVKAGTAGSPIVYDEWNTVFGGHAPAGSDYVGVIVPRYTTIRSDQPEYPQYTVLYFDGHYGIADEMTYEDAYKKCLFHLSGKTFDAKIQGFTLRSKDCRYSFHAESNVDAYQMTWYLENCIIDWRGSDYWEETGWFGHAVGLGIGYGGKGIIKECKWINKQEHGNGITGHTNGWNPYVPTLPTMPGAELEIINCDLGGYDVSMGNSVDGNELNNVITFHNVVNCAHNTSTGWMEVLEATEFTGE